MGCVSKKNNKTTCQSVIHSKVLGFLPGLTNSGLEISKDSSRMEFCDKTEEKRESSSVVKTYQLHGCNNCTTQLICTLIVQTCKTIISLNHDHHKRKAISLS